MSIILKNSTLNITEADIALCTDVNLLIDWKIKVDAEINSIRLQIEKAKVRYQEENKPTDKMWLLRAEAARKYHGQISQLIQNRVKKVRIEQHNANNAARERTFIIAAKKILSNELFMEIIAETEQLLNQPPLK